MFLKADFDQAKSSFYRDMLFLVGNRQTGSFPAWKPERWDTKTACYGFVLNLPEAGRTTPGLLTGKQQSPKDKDFDDYVRDVREGAISDGLRFLGNNLSGLSNGETPAALFFRADKDSSRKLHDYHWFTVRQKGSEVMWMHKPGRHRPVEFIQGKREHFFFCR